MSERVWPDQGVGEALPFQQQLAGSSLLSLLRKVALTSGFRSLLLLAGLVLLLPQTSIAQAAPKSWPLPELMKFKAGDDLRFKESEYNDADWQSVALDDANRAGLLLDAAGRGWFRLHFDAPEASELQNSAIYLGLIGCADEVYLNGELIGKTGDLQSLSSASFRRVRAYDLPAHALVPGEKNVLAIRGINFLSQRMVEGPLFVGSAHDVYEKARAAHSRWWFSDTLFATICALAFVGWLLLYLSGWGFAGSAWVGLTFAAIAVSTSADLVIIDSEQPPAWAWTVSKLAYQMYMVAYLLAVRAIVAGKLRWLTYAVCGASVLNALLGVLAPYQWQETLMLLSVALGSLGIPLNLFWIFQERHRPFDMSRRLALLGGLGFALLMLWHFICMRTSLVGRTEIHVWFTELVIALTCIVLFGAASRRVLMARDRQLNFKASYAAAGIRERRRLAQDLHDGVVQDICAARLTLETAKMLPESDREELVDDVLDALKSASESLRIEARKLFSESGESWASFVSRMKAQAEARDMVLGFEKVDALQDSLSGAVAHQVQQFFAEAITNSILHSGGSEIFVTVRRNGTMIELNLSDNGTRVGSKAAKALRKRVLGSPHSSRNLESPQSQIRISNDSSVNPSQALTLEPVESTASGTSSLDIGSTGIGLSTMRERAAQLGAYFNIRFSPQGARIELHVDLASDFVQNSLRDYEDALSPSALEL